MTEAAFVATDDYFEQIEAAILETPRGRWFLREYAQRNQGANTERVLKAVTDLRSSMGQGTGLSHVEILRRELQEMSHSIVQTRQEIAAIKPTDHSGNNRIMVATEELDAIVTATERATSDILTAAERLALLADDLTTTGADQRLCEEVSNLATHILMACSFQDITGQRTTKVVHVLRYLEQRVNAMIEIWGVDGVKQKLLDTGDTRPDAHLISGPPRDGEGILQDVVDQLMSGAEAAESAAAAEPIPMARPAPAPVPPPAPAIETEGGEGIDQSEIDRLFA
jgi:chemotaxis regulatin CheY-phosphate phosphatase CheZ